MSYRLFRILAILTIFSATILSGAADAASAPPPPPAQPATIMYSAGGHLWTRSVDGGPARVINTPWPLSTREDSPQGAQWSPDGRRVALDDGKSRLAIINLTTGHVATFAGHLCKTCYAPNYSWSPNGRYLAILQPTDNGDTSTLSVWDSATGTRRALLPRPPRSALAISTYGGGADWSHDGTRLAVNTGRFDTIKRIFPSVTVVDLAGHARSLTKGLESAWSPDDRFLAVVRPNECGASTCDDSELVLPSGGGAAITLIRHLDGNFEDIEWAKLPGGYGFDRWLLGPAAHIRRRLANLSERVDSWQPGGAHLALQSYHPYYSTPDTLYISTPAGARTKLYTDGPNEGCGACSKDVYTVAWSHNGRLLAFSTPEYPAPKTMKTVYPLFFVAGIDGTNRTRIPIPGADAINILGFVDNDSALVIRSGKKIYRYDIPTRRLAVLATGVVSAGALPAIYPK